MIPIFDINGVAMFAMLETPEQLVTSGVMIPVTPDDWLNVVVYCFNRKWLLDN